MKQTKFFALLLCATALFACNKNESNGGGEVESGKPTEVNIIIPASASTYAPSGEENGTNKENKINVLELYVFDAAGAIDNKVGTANGYVKFTNYVAGTSKRVLVSSGSNKKFVAVVNMNLGAVANYAALKAKMAAGEFKASAALDHNSRNEDIATGFEMVGEVVSTIVADKIDNQVAIKASRLVSKINAPTFKNGAGDATINLSDEEIEKVWGAASGVTNAKITFKFKGYAVINGISKSTAFFTASTSGKELEVSGLPNWDLWSWTGKNYLNSTFAAGQYTNNYSGKVGSDWFLDGVAANNGHRVYVYENKPDVTTDGAGQVGYDPLCTYAYIIKGDLEVTGDASKKKTRYWRVDLIRTDDYHILRNCVYNVNIKNLSTGGESTPEEAEKEPEIIPGKDQTAADVVVTVNKWRLNPYETEM